VTALRAQCCAILVLVWAGAAPAAVPASTQLEINALLADVGTSGCEFYRNGTWYDARRAQEHLTMKYQALARRNQIATAEDFIALVATKSSLSGERYQIRCPSTPLEYSAQWLKDRLQRNRARDAAGMISTAPLTGPTSSR
jgi:hypothetical protein